MRNIKLWMIIVVMILGTVTTLYASSMKKLEAEKKAIEAAFEDTQARLVASEKQLIEIHNHIKQMELEIIDMSYRVESIELNLKNKRVEVENIKLELQTVRQDQKILFKQARERISVLYEYGNTSYLDILFESKNLVDFYNRMEYVNRIVEFDLNLFDRLDAAEKKILAQEAQLEVEEVNLINLATEAAQEQQALEDKVVAKTLEIHELIDDQTAYEGMMEAYEADQKKIDEEIDELIRLSKLTYGGGQMMWPLPGWYNLSSPFGPRFHPIRKKWRTHNGIDIPAPRGTSIIAAAKGNVIVARYGTSFGNYVLIDHGSGYATVYGHCSKLLVKSGQSVNGGEIIAQVGTTGYSTGNHLHFGVKHNGKWVDPMEYLK